MRYIFIAFFSCFYLLSNAQNIGISGMEKMSASKYLVVLDKKNNEDGERIAILKVSDKGISVDKLKIKDWKHKDGRSSDLESVCAVPGEKNEFLLLESGYWNKKYGRIFHVKFDEDKLKVIEVYQLPKILPGGKDNPEGDNFEGAVCIKNGEDYYIILGERGGTQRLANGVLRIGKWHRKKKKVDWQSYADYSLEAKLPKGVNKPAHMRTISDLHVNKEGVLFASAAVDDSNVGPYKSIIYQLGVITFKKGKLEIAPSKNKLCYTIDGFKVEGLAASPKFMENSRLCFGTEDEKLGGEWRALYQNDK